MELQINGPLYFGQAEFLGIHCSGYKKISETIWTNDNFLASLRFTQNSKSEEINVP